MKHFSNFTVFQYKRRIIIFLKTNSYKKINLSHIRVTSPQKKIRILREKRRENIDEKEVTPWEINGVYCNPAELTDFIHYPYYEDLSSNSCFYR